MPYTCHILGNIIIYYYENNIMPSVLSGCIYIYIYRYAHGRFPYREIFRGGMDCHRATQIAGPAGPPITDLAASRRITQPRDRHSVRSSAAALRSRPWYTATRPLYIPTWRQTIIIIIFACTHATRFIVQTHTHGLCCGQKSYKSNGCSASVVGV